jgi:hypothetical protein
MRCRVIELEERLLELEDEHGLALEIIHFK